MRIAVGANHRGFGVRCILIELLEHLGHEVVDVGVFEEKPVDYPDVACLVAGKVHRGEVDLGILVGGMGLGMAIAANKLPGIRAALCHDEMTAEMSRRHYDVNVLCLSAALVGTSLIGRIVEVWINTPFEGGRHARRLKKVALLERGAAPGDSAATDESVNAPDLPRPDAP